MKSEITIRKADFNDTEEIWELLRVEKEMWSTEKILMNIENLFVIIYKNSIISVLHGTTVPGREKIDWVAVHPGYPENSVSYSMIYMFWGIICRKPAERAVYKVPDDVFSKSRQKIKNHLDNGMEGVLNEVSFEQGIGVSNLSAVGGTD
jgi:hypothetical protein